ncbi:nuclear transport factor 2 family protein [Pseudoalteromonas umbrosa]|uniref:nuclear transport factor 2 family protein n=1 Tax=Pseudoalteromonas umbrosa TaxID=3048489 RepID=UPI0024C41DCE|nr:nuclear transport factor 2 family protein [Pseudoalteromonas sp. B95]MDK1288365.1 nuclear transport factor 2 family protein [Pseudoalteromonas sp. B95]
MTRLLFILISYILTFTIFTASAKEFNTPQEAVGTYITGVTLGIGKNIEMAFQKTATIQYFDERGQYQIFGRDQFMQRIDTGNKWAANVEITNLLITENIANATVEFTWGKEKQHGYVDYINLIFDGEQWQITSKVAQYISRQPNQ